VLPTQSGREVRKHTGSSSALSSRLSQSRRRLNGAEHLRTKNGDYYVAFADNVDPTHLALRSLAALGSPDTPAVLAAPFDMTAAHTHGVIVCSGDGPVQPMVALVEKPGHEQAAQLAAKHGTGNLRLLQGRMRVTPQLSAHVAATARRTEGEPKLSLAIAAYARSHRVDVITHTTPLTDLGQPNRQEDANPHLEPSSAPPDQG
ncbi:hypothetical protein ACWCXC_28965, partial [Streptomyces sp. NPDC001515]